MEWYILAQFSGAALLILLTPGPVMAIIAHNTLRHGTTAGLSTVMGVAIGDACLLGAMFAGLTLSSELLPSLFRWLSLAGAFYLIWLAAGTLRSRDRSARSLNLWRSRKPIFAGLTIAFANPAALLFYAAFFPQFISPHHSIHEQTIVLSAIYICMVLAFDTACVLTVARLRLPAGGTRLGVFADLGSATVYLSIAVVAIHRFIEASG